MTLALTSPPRHGLLVTLTVLALVLIGCAGSGRLNYETPEEAYNRGMEHYEDGRYMRAAEYFRGAFDFGRAHAHAADAQLMLARAHRENGDMLLAANEYQRFIQIYRSDERVQEATYEYAMTFVARSPRYQLDQTDTQRAVQELQLFIDRYPSSAHVASAEAEIRQLREKLGRKEYESAKLYERRDIYESAAITFEGVFDRYPDTEWADDALAGAIRNYVEFSRASVAAKQAERFQKAAELFDRLVEIFPDSPHIDDTRAVIDGSRDLAAN